jgi:hypothetical protein
MTKKATSTKATTAKKANTAKKAATIVAPPAATVHPESRGKNGQTGRGGKGWKMEFIKDRFDRLLDGRVKNIRRAFLAEMIGSDERNTHIMISKIQEKGGYPDVDYNRADKAYFLKK